MATYYKYAERSAESQVNWAEIGKNMTDMLREEVAVREQKKAALNEATRQAAEQISNAPQGAHESAKAEAIRLADQATKYLLMQDRLMKQGILDPKDYMISRQNLSDGVKGAYTSMKAFQENYGKLLERAQKDESSMIELKRLEKIQGYGNFSQSGFFIDAPTGNLNVGLKEEQLIDGQKVIGLKKGSSVGMQYIDGAIYGQIDKFKYNDRLKAMADSLGDFVTSNVTPGSLSKIGYVTSLSDARRRINEMQIGSDDKKILYDFYASSYDSIGTMLSNDDHKASVLVDAMASKGYFWTDDPDEAAKNPKAVLETIDPGTGRGVMTFTKEQDQDAADFLMQQYLGMVDVVEEQKSTGQIQDQSRPPTDAQRKDVENKNVLSNVAKLYYGTDAEVEEASNFLRSFNPSIDTIDRSGNNITITYKDGRPPEIRAWKGEGGELLDQEGWVTANTNFFLPEGNRIGNVKELINRGGIDRTREFNPNSTGFSAGTTQEKEDIPVAFKRIAQERSGLTTATFEKDDETKTANNLRKVIASLKGLEGVTLEEASPGYNVVELKDKDGVLINSFDLDNLTPEIAQGYVNQLLEMASNRTKIEDQAIYVGKDRGVSAPQQRTSTRTNNLPPR